MYIENVIIGAGISGLSAAYHLKLQNIESVIFEKENFIGGLCSSFDIDGFVFDRFVHFSHTDNEYAISQFLKGTEFIHHDPICSNLYGNKWLKHPAQNNLFPLDIEEKVEIITSFIERKEFSSIDNYQDWLICQYGDIFYERFPLKYTRKYWCQEPKNLCTSWVGKRMYKPTIQEVLYGAMSDDTPNTYYAKKMRYPISGGFQSILNHIKQGHDIRINHKLKEIDTKSKELKFTNGVTVNYKNLISSLPLSKIHEYIKNIPNEVKEASNKLRCTSGYHISVIFKGEPTNDSLWFYVYNEDIIFSRVYYSSRKSSNNTKPGYSTLQAEVYFLENHDKKMDEIHNLVLDQLFKNKIISKNDFVKSEIHIEKFANVIFDHYISKNRTTVLSYLDQENILSVGRFGRWGYLWSDQSFNSSKIEIEKNIRLFR